MERNVLQQFRHIERTGEDRTVKSCVGHLGREVGLGEFTYTTLRRCDVVAGGERNECEDGSAIG